MIHHTKDEYKQYKTYIRGDGQSISEIQYRLFLGVMDLRLPREESQELFARYCESYRLGRGHLISTDEKHGNPIGVSFYLEGKRKLHYIDPDYRQEKEISETLNIRAPKGKPLEQNQGGSRDLSKLIDAHSIRWNILHKQYLEKLSQIKPPGSLMMKLGEIKTLEQIDIEELVFAASLKVSEAPLIEVCAALGEGTVEQKAWLESAIDKFSGLLKDVKSTYLSDQLRAAEANSPRQKLIKTIAQLYPSGEFPGLELSSYSRVMYCILGETTPGIPGHDGHNTVRAMYFDKEGFTGQTKYKTYKEALDAAADIYCYVANGTLKLMSLQDSFVNLIAKNDLVQNDGNGLTSVDSLLDEHQNHQFQEDDFSPGM